MTLKRRIARLEAQGETLGKLPGAVLVVGDPQNLTEAEAQELVAVQTRVRPGGTVVLLPDNGRGDR